MNKVTNKALKAVLYLLTQLVLVSIIFPIGKITTHSQYGQQKFSGYNEIDYPSELTKISQPINGKLGNLVEINPIAGTDKIEGVLLNNVLNGEITISLGNIEEYYNPKINEDILSTYIIRMRNMSLEDIEFQIKFKHRTTRIKEYGRIKVFQINKKSKISPLDKEMVYCNCEDEITYGTAFSNARLIFTSVIKEPQTNAIIRFVNKYQNSISLWSLVSIIIWTIVHLFFYPKGLFSRV